MTKSQEKLQIWIAWTLKNMLSRIAAETTAAGDLGWADHLRAQHFQFSECFDEAVNEYKVLYGSDPLQPDKPIKE